MIPMSIVQRTKEYFLKKMKLRSIKKYGVEALSLIHEAGKTTGRYVWLEYGTLLGAYRDHGFIAHDDDIDLCMYATDFDHIFMRALYDRGFKIIRKFTIVDAAHPEKQSVTEVTLKFHMVYIDIFLRFRDVEKSYNILWAKVDPIRNLWKANRDYFDFPGFDEIDFLGIRFLVPTNAKEYLEAKYGLDFMTPQPNWHPAPKVYLSIEECYGEVMGGWIG